MLPKAVPVREKVNPARINMPDAFEKLRKSDFSGYLRFDHPAGTGLALFEEGRLAEAVFEENEGLPLKGCEALRRIFGEAVCGEVSLHIYKTSAQLASVVRAMLRGKSVFSPREIARVGVAKLLEKVRGDALSCCLRCCAEGKVALIFYRQGKPLGFFHEGSTQIETTADLNASLAREKGCTLEVLSCIYEGGSAAVDHFAHCDVAGLWTGARAALAEQQRSKEEALVHSVDADRGIRRNAVLECLQRTAEEFVGKVGPALVEKNFRSHLPPGAEFDENRQRLFFEALDRGARLVAGPKKVQSMMEQMKNGLAAMARQE